MTTIELEDYNGNTIGSFRIKAEVSMTDFDLFQDCDIADEDEDYINEEKNLIRIQLSKKGELQ